MINKMNLCVIIALLCSAPALTAGDTASFVDLGFSPDGATYMFAQYGVQSGSLKPWADLFAVDVPRNNFVPGGKISFVHNSPVVPGTDGSGAFYRVIAKNASLAEKYGITFLLPGQPLYIALDETGSGESVEFRDFEAGTSFKATINSHVEGSGASLKSSFYITLERTTKGGAKKTYTVGTPDLKRPLVSSYRLYKVMAAPGDGSLIFVIQMKKREGDSIDIRYMVEALKL
jgi:predicted secreted protein